MTKVRMAMTTVLLAISANPSFLSTCQSPPSINLQKSTSHGAKFWKGCALPHGLSIRFGRLGTIGQCRLVEQDRCVNANPVRELMNRALTKIHEGYRLAFDTA
jgi:predicted DNA-binding WGR domain protein